VLTHDAAQRRPLIEVLTVWCACNRADECDQDLCERIMALFVLHDVSVQTTVADATPYLEPFIHELSSTSLIA